MVRNFVFSASKKLGAENFGTKWGGVFAFTQLVMFATGILVSLFSVWGKN